MQNRPRFFQAPEWSFFLFGPRGTGKTTYLRARFPQALWIDLLDPAVLKDYEPHPERLYAAVAALAPGSTVVIDEVQKVPLLLSVVHSLIDQKRGLQFVLTGSSMRKLRKPGVDLLAGRALLRHMHPFVAGELGELFDLNKALVQGMLPVAWATPDPTLLAAYCGAYLNEEVRAEGIVRDVGTFARFLEVLSFSHGAIVNATNISRECGVSRPTVENYILIVKDMMLGYTLPVFQHRAKRELTSHPKFYFFDAGVYATLRPQGYADKPEELYGVALEGLVGQHLCAWIDMQQERYSLTFWRTRSQMEVDFIVYGPKGFWAIEVKHNEHIAPRDLHGLFAFCEDNPEATPLFLYRGRERLKYKNVLCIPVDEFLRDIRPDTPLWPMAHFAE